MPLTAEQLKSRYDRLMLIGLTPIANLSYRDGIWKYWAVGGQWVSIYVADVEAIIERYARDWWLKSKRHIRSLDISGALVTARRIIRKKTSDPHETVFDHVTAETVIDAILSADEKEKTANEDRKKV